MRIALAQINTIVGDFNGNAYKIIASMNEAKKTKTDLIVFCELTICGYPPEDLLLKAHFINDNIKFINALAKKCRGITAIVGFVDSDGKGRLFNAAAVLSQGIVKSIYHKQELPNYGVFDEKRYFKAGENNGIINIGKHIVGLNICEDIWIEDAVWRKQSKKADIIINISSSPYETGKVLRRQALLVHRAKEIKLPIIYVNALGGQDELVFDGASMAIDANGEAIARAKQFEEDLIYVSLEGKKVVSHQQIEPLLDENAEIYQALVTGTRDYVIKNGFNKVALGLSGGIDSALVACIAVDALGKENVSGFSMPSKYNSKGTRNDARELAKNLGIAFKEIPIESIYKQYLKTLKVLFKGTAPNIAEENIQARIRGNLLMALSNKFGWLILTTGNKSEMAVGYCTLYGDMSGGFAVIKDIFKTKVYQLCRWRNAQGEKLIIPKTTILRAPSAELRPNQTDEASLGSYEELDKILSMYIQGHQSYHAIVASGLDSVHVKKILRLVDINEYKRRQSPPGVKITPRSFGKDWRLPITNKYREE